MHWAYWNPVAIRFGAGAFKEMGRLIGKRSYALVTYNQPVFKDMAVRLVRLAGEPIAVIDNIDVNGKLIGR